MSWTSRVACAHSAVLARASTVEAWTAHAPGESDCAPVTDAGRWGVGIVTETAADRAAVGDLVASMSGEGLALAGAVARLTRHDLPPCSVLLSDGELAAGLAWGRPLGLSEVGAWEFALTSEPLPDHDWAPLAPGTIAVLDSCGPTLFRLPYPQEKK